MEVRGGAERPREGGASERVAKGRVTWGDAVEIPEEMSEA